MASSKRCKPRVRHLLPLRRVGNISEALEERAARHHQMPQCQTPVQKIYIIIYIYTYIIFNILYIYIIICNIV